MPTRKPFETRHNDTLDLRFNLWQQIWEMLLERKATIDDVATKLDMDKLLVGRAFGDWRYIDLIEFSYIATALDFHVDINSKPLAA